MMRSPHTVGAALIGVSLCALLTPLVALGVYFLDLPSWDMAELPESPPPSSLMGVAGRAITLALQAILQAVRLLPRLVACSLTAYLGVCAGYVALVHLGAVDPDKRLQMQRR